MNLKHILLLSLLFLCASLKLLAQVHLQGSIVNKNTAHYIANASIQIVGTSLGTISNANGEFLFYIPKELEEKEIRISSVGYSSLHLSIQDFKNNTNVYLTPEAIALEGIVLHTGKPLSGEEIMQKALEKLTDNLPDKAYLTHAFFRQLERNETEYKWLIESAITTYDSGKQDIQLNIEEIRSSLDLRTVDSLLLYKSYLVHEKGYSYNQAYKDNKNMIMDTVSPSELVKAIRWHDTRTNSLTALFNGPFNLFRNREQAKAIFGKQVFETHSFALDSSLIDNERILYKIKISPNDKALQAYDGLAPEGWVYVYKDNYAVKQIEYVLVAASVNQKLRSELLFGSKVLHKVVIQYLEYEGKLYPKYMSYETPKTVNIGLESNPGAGKRKDVLLRKEDRFYNSKQEIVFTEIITELKNIHLDFLQNWNSDIFQTKPYNTKFWDNYNVLLESLDEKKMRLDLEKNISLKAQFQKQ